MRRLRKTNFKIFFNHGEHNLVILDYFGEFQKVNFHYFLQPWYEYDISVPENRRKSKITDSRCSEIEIPRIKSGKIVIFGQGKPGNVREIHLPQFLTTMKFSSTIVKRSSETSKAESI